MEKNEIAKRVKFFKWVSIILWSVSACIVVYTIAYMKSTSDWSYYLVTIWYFIVVILLASTATAYAIGSKYFWYRSL
jgi:hypothetical protein